MDKLLFFVPTDAVGERLDQWLTTQINDITRSAAQKLCVDQMVLVAGNPVAKNYRLRGGEQVEVSRPSPQPLDAVPQDIPIEIVYEDNDLLVVNKPKGMVVHPAPGNYDSTLVNALLHHCKDRLSSINGVIRPGIVHRIDKNTSGLLIVAKNDVAHLGLADQIKVHSFTREYQAIVYGRMGEGSGTVNAPIGRRSDDRMKMCVTVHNSKEAITHYETIQELIGFSHLKLLLETGRTHQIRVHLAYLGHPVAGDPIYGPKKVITQLHGQCLHASKIGFIHPKTGSYLEFSAPLPLYFSKFLKSVGGSLSK